MNKLEKVGVGDEKENMRVVNYDNVGDVARISTLGGAACSMAGRKRIPEDGR